MILSPTFVVQAKKGCSCLLIILFTIILKAFYSAADSKDLAWILGPTAWLTEQISGLSFARESGVGWVNLEHMFVIAPACAGVNFLIIAFCMSSFQGIFHKNGTGWLIGWPCMAGFAAYAVTLVANTARIWLSVISYRADIYSGWFTSEAAHRIVGVSVYYLFLCFYYQAVSFILNNEIKSARQFETKHVHIVRLFVFIVPLFWYLLFSLGVPYVNNAYQLQPERFFEHMSSVVGISLLLTLILFFVSRIPVCVRLFFHKRD